MKNHGLSRSGIGVISIFMVLIILTLSLLAVLSYVNANQKAIRSERYKRNVSEYYEVDRHNIQQELDLQK